MTRESRKELKAALRKKIQEERRERRRIRSLSGDEKKSARLTFRENRKREKTDLKQLKGDEKKRRKRFLKRYGRMKRRPILLAILAVLILTPVLIIAANYREAVRPPSEAVRASRAHSALVAEEIQAEGSVLLKNQGALLPLANKAINVFGTRSITPSYGGGGSGSINADDALNLYEALENEGFAVNKELYNLYANWRYNKSLSTEAYQHNPKKSLLQTILPNIVGVLGTERFDELDPDAIPAAVLERAKAHSDTALMVVGAFSREAISDSSMVDKTQEGLSLRGEVRAHLEILNREFENVVVLINAGNAMELGWLEELENVRAALWIGFPGEAGMAGVAGLLSGRYNPSGRLTDTFAYHVMSSPAARLIGDHDYTNLPDQNFMNYNEGIYVGYRFYETYYQDDEEAYEKAVQFPFGYGLSYTRFDWTPVSFERRGERLILEVEVTNSGERAGKDVVQAYYAPPYHEESGLEKAAINLADFAKTRELLPGESQRLTLAFPIREMASYDYRHEEAWVLDEGEYRIILARNAHDFETSYTYRVPERRVYKRDEETGTVIRNLFEDAHGGLRYLSRENFDGTMAGMTDYNHTAPASVIDAVNSVREPAGGEMPRFGADNGLQLKDLRGLTYDDPLWDRFLDQFTLKEMIAMTASGGWKTIGIKRLGIPATLDYDGPSSIRHYFGKWATLGFPNANTVAQTWNGKLQYAMAEAMAREADEYDIDVWYAPGMNIHRSPLGARNFEYFSEDPLVSGRTAASLIDGAASQGMTVTIKHFAMNNQDTNRTGVFTWANEQAIREIYLKSFEIAVKEASPYGAMSAMNRIGHTWCGANPALLKDLLRREWGFRGFVVTDITIGDYMRAEDCVTSGNDLMLFLTSGKHKKNIKEAYKRDPAGIARGLRDSVHNISYMVLQTRAMEKVSREE